MSNYRYKISDEDIIVSQEEHNKIQDAVKSGAGHLSLRGGSMGVNLAYCQFWKETERNIEPTAEQKKAHEDLMKLAPENRPQQNSNLLSGPKYGGFQKVGGENGHRECAECRQEHYIPEGKELCLPCSIKRQK